MRHRQGFGVLYQNGKGHQCQRSPDSGSTISTLFHDKINPKDCQVLSLGDSGFLQFFRVVSRDYGTPRDWSAIESHRLAGRSPRIFGSD